MELCMGGFFVDVTQTVPGSRAFFNAVTAKF